MINYGIIYGLAIIGNCILLSATILTPFKIDPSSLHLYKTGLRNELDYILKRSTTVQNVDESPDSKERRSQMGSSFIRFGRSRLEDNQENLEYPLNNNFHEIEDETSASRIPRGRSDVIIRFGRAMRPKFNSIGEHGKLLKLLPATLEQFYLLCPDVLSLNAGTNDHDLTRLCSSLAAGLNESEKN